MFKNELDINLKSIDYILKNEKRKGIAISFSDEIEIVDIQPSMVTLEYTRKLETQEDKYHLLITFKITVYAKDGITLSKDNISLDYFRNNFDNTIGICAFYMSNVISQITSFLGELPIITPPKLLIPEKSNN